MVKRKNPYAGIEPGLRKANTDIIFWNSQKTFQIKCVAERIVKKIVKAMKEVSPVFKKLYCETFCGGSSFEGLKVGLPGDFDMDLLLELPPEIKPRLRLSRFNGFVELEVENDGVLRNKDPELFRVLGDLTEDGFLLSTKLKSFIESVFDRALNTIPNRTVIVGNKKYEITKVQKLGPAFTLTMDGFGFKDPLQIDLVPCIRFGKQYWPGRPFKPNFVGKPSNFFIVPKQPKVNQNITERCFRLSFQMQEKHILADRFWMKPTIRILKLIKERFGHEHDVSSYAIKTFVMQELLTKNQRLEKQTPPPFIGSFSNCVIEMLEKYLQCLENYSIPYLWHEDLNLLDNLSKEQIDVCARDIRQLLQEVKANPTAKTILQYLEQK